MSTPSEPERLVLKRIVARNLRRLQEELGWTQTRLLQQLRDQGSDMTQATLSRLQQEQDVPRAVAPPRTADLKVQELLDLARALGVSPMALLAPPNSGLWQLGRQGPVISGRQFRRWLLGKRPLEPKDADRYYANPPDAVEQSPQWHEMQSLAAEAVWAAQDDEVGYGEAMQQQEELKRSFQLLLEEQEIAVRRRDPHGAAQYRRRRQQPPGSADAHH